MNGRFLVVVACIIQAPSILAYEQFTHATLTWRAVSSSELSSAQSHLLEALDLPNQRSLDVDGRYFDIANPLAGVAGSSIRIWQSYENDMFNALRVDIATSDPKHWIVRGAIREDDNPNEDPPTPQDVSPGLKRPLHHFFDPYKNRPLNGGGVGAVDGDIHRNPDWAIGSSDSFARPNTPELGRRNHFSLADARESMFRALTLKWRDTDGSFKDLSLANPDSTTYELWRKAYWATAFRALGDSLHLIQDMAQPQHTRNEAHSGMLCRGASTCLGGHASVYEKYINARANLSGVFKALAPFNVPVRLQPDSLPNSTYEIPTFTKYSDYWSTSPGQESVSGLGLADYSNRGFFTAKYNFGNTEYPNPSSARADYSIENHTPTTWNGTPLVGAPVYVYKGSVPDKVRNLPTTDVALTSYGVWDQFMERQGAAPAFTLNRINYDAMADLLIPRAVAYSAGLLDFFFRGRMEITVPDAGFFAIEDHARFAPAAGTTPTDPMTNFRGFRKLKLKLKNTTADITPPNGAPTQQLMTGGSVFAVVKFNRDRCYDDLLANWPLDRLGAQGCRVITQEIVVSDPLVVAVPAATAARPDGDELTFDFTNRQIPINAWNVMLQVVYRGKLGSEDDAVVVATKDLSEPTFVSFQNATDYVLLDGQLYTPADLRTNYQALFTNVRTTCRTGNPGSYQVWSACYGFTDNFLFSAVGAPGVAISTAAGTIPPRRFGRVALLTDLSARPRFSFDNSAVSCWVYLANPFELAPYRSQIDAQAGGPFTPPDIVRDVRSWNTVTCYADIGSTLTPAGTANLHQLDALFPDEKVPLPIAISGW